MVRHLVRYLLELGNLDSKTLISAILRQNRFIFLFKFTVYKIILLFQQFKSFMSKSRWNWGCHMYPEQTKESKQHRLPSANNIGLYKSTILCWDYLFYHLHKLDLTIFEIHNQKSLNHVIHWFCFFVKTQCNLMGFLVNHTLRFSLIPERHLAFSVEKNRNLTLLMIVQLLTECFGTYGTSLDG